MKKFLVLSVATMLFMGVSSNTNASTVLENFNSWPTSSPVNNVNSTWQYQPFGAEKTASAILDKGSGDKYLQLSYSSPADGGSLLIGGSGPYTSLVLAQNTAFSPILNLTDPTTKIEFDLRSSAQIADVFSVEIQALPVFGDGTPAGSTPTGFRLGFDKMLDLPGDTWTHFAVLVSDLTTFSDDQSVTSKHPDLTNVTKVQLLVLQTDADLIGTGTIDIDNLAISPSVPEPGAMLLFGFAGLFGFVKRKISKK